METKVFRRFVYVIEVYKDSEFLGFYTGRDKQDIIHYDKSFASAMVIRTPKGGEHILYNLKKHHGDEFSFTKVDCMETFTTTYYDDYDNVNPKKVGAYYTIRIKSKTDILSEPGYLSKYDKTDNSFESSLNIEKAIMTGEYGSNKMLYHLSRKYEDKYVFYVDRLFVEKNRNIRIIGNIY